MQNSARNREAGNLNANTEQFPPASRRPRCIMELAGDRVRLSLDATAISAETIERIKAVVTEADRAYLWSSPDWFPARWVRQGGRVRLYFNEKIYTETRERVNALLAEGDQRHGDSNGLNNNNLSINDLATELDVSRRTIERALKDRLLVPTAHEGGRARFSREYADRMKDRAREARLRGFKNIVGIAAGTGPIVSTVQVQRTQPMSAAQWTRATLWKRRHLPRQSWRPKATDGPVKSRPLPVLTPDEIEARARLAADRATLAEERRKRQPEERRESVLMRISPYMEPQSREQALTTIWLLLKLVRAHPGEDAAQIVQVIDGFRRSLWRERPRKLALELTTLKEAIPYAQNLESRCADVVHRALTNLVAWCERSNLLTPRLRKRRRRR